MPPARDTAAQSSGPATDPVGACQIGSLGSKMTPLEELWGRG